MPCNTVVLASREQMYKTASRKQANGGGELGDGTSARSRLALVVALETGGNSRR